MKFDHRDISEISDAELLSAYSDMQKALEKREQAAKHRKFANMPFPPINFEFLDWKKALEVEISKRNIKVAEPTTVIISEAKPETVQSAPIIESVISTPSKTIESANLKPVDATLQKYSMLTNNFEG